MFTQNVLASEFYSDVSRWMWRVLPTPSLSPDFPFHFLSRPADLVEPGIHRRNTSLSIDFVRIWPTQSFCILSHEEGIAMICTSTFHTENPIGLLKTYLGRVGSLLSIKQIRTPRFQHSDLFLQTYVYISML